MSVSVVRCWRQASARPPGTDTSTLYLPTVGIEPFTVSIGLVCPSTKATYQVSIPFILYLIITTSVPSLLKMCNINISFYVHFFFKFRSFIFIDVQWLLLLLKCF